MGTRIEVTVRLRRAYRSASKSEKSQVLDQFCASTGLARSTARRYLTSPTIANKKLATLDRRRQRGRKYSAQAQRVLIRIWKMMGCPCGKYMASQMSMWLNALQTHGELVIGEDGFSEDVKDELVVMSPATIDRYLKAERDRLSLKGMPTTTRKGAVLRTSITVRKAGDNNEDEPGFFEADTVAHCGPTVRGEYARTLTLTDICTGWVHLEVMRNNARVHMLAALDAAATAIPFAISGLDCDNGSEFLNNDIIVWAGARDIFFTRSRPYKKNDQAHVESKNNHVVRRYGFYYRYDTAEQRQVLAQLWQAVCLKMNYFMPTRKPIGWSQNAQGKRKRLYDDPATPLDRLIDSGILSPDQTRELLAIRDCLNPAALTRDILRYQDMLISLAKDTTQALINAQALRAQKRAQQLQGGYHHAS